jgi:hypothetical protein
MSEYDNMSKTELTTHITKKLYWIKERVRKLTKEECLIILKNQETYILLDRICNCCGIKKSIMSEFKFVNDVLQRKCKSCNNKNRDPKFDKLELEEEMKIIIDIPSKNNKNDKNENMLNNPNKIHDDLSKSFILNSEKIITQTDQTMMIFNDSVLSLLGKFNSLPLIIDDELGAINRFIEFLNKNAKEEIANIIIDKKIPTRFGIPKAPKAPKISIMPDKTKLEFVGDISEFVIQSCIQEFYMGKTIIYPDKIKIVKEDGVIRVLSIQDMEIPISDIKKIRSIIKTQIKLAV